MTWERSERIPLHLSKAIANNLKVLDGAVISFDIDAVIQATYIKALNYASHQLGRVIHKEELVTYWELVEICKKEGVDPSKAHDFAKGLWNNRNVYRDAPEVPGSKSLLRILKAIEQPIIFVSSRPDVFIDTTNTWFNSTFPWIGNKDIYLGRQHSQEGGVYKSGVIQALNVQLHFEDALEEAKDIISSTEAKVIIVPQPWNLVCDFESQKMKTFSSYSADAGMWPVIRFLASPEAAEFLGRVVQS